jgi:hypothetical protein
VNLLPFFELFFGFIDSLILLLETTLLTIGSYSVSYMHLVYAFLVIGFVVTLFWKGAKA